MNNSRIMPKATNEQTKSKLNMEVVCELEVISGHMYELKNRTSLSLEGKIKVVDDMISHVNKTIRAQPLDEKKFAFIFRETNILLEPSQPFEIRKRIWKFYTQIIQRRSEALGTLRYALFELVNKYECKNEEMALKIDFLVALTENGKELGYYEAEFSTLIIDLLSTLIEKKPQNVTLKKLDYQARSRFLELLTNLIKFNSPHLGFESSSALVQIMNYVCLLSYETDSMNELENIYKFLNDATCYTSLPSDCLNQLVMVLCVGINKKEFHQICQNIISQLIGSFLGYATLSTLLYIIEDQTNYSDKILIRGAVYFLIKSIWEDLGKKPKQNYSKLSPNEVLPAFKNLILNSSISSPIILTEITSGILNFLRKKFSNNTSTINNDKIISDNFDEQIRNITHARTWDLVLDICYVLVEKANTQQPNELTSIIQLLIEQLNTLLQRSFMQDDNESWSNILPSKEKFASKVFAILELDIRLLSDESLIKLINYRFLHIRSHPHTWDEQMNAMIDVYYNTNVSSSIRKHFLEDLQEFIGRNSKICQPDSFWDKVACHYFSNSPNSDMINRELGVDFLIFLALQCNSTKNIMEISDVLDSIASHHWLKCQRHHSVDILQQQTGRTPPISHQNSAPTTPFTSSNEYRADPLGSIQGLIKIFLAKFDQQHGWQAAQHCFRILVKIYQQMKTAIIDQELLNQHPISKNEKIIFNKVKSLIFALILSLRMNSRGQLGVITGGDEKSLKFSVYIVLKKPEHVAELVSPLPASSPQVAIYQPLINRTPTTPSELFICSFFDSFKFVIECIESECDWTILTYVLENLTKLLKNKALIIFLGSIADVFRLVIQQSNITTPTSNSQAGSPISPPPIPISKKIPETYFSDHLVETINKIIEGRLNRSKMLQKIDSDGKINTVTFLEPVYKLLTELIGYPLQPSSHSLIIECMKNGLVLLSQRPCCIRQCIVAFTLCLIEMPSAMSRSFREIIQKLCQISSNKTLAIPTLQFLSNVLIFPDFHYTFDKDIFMFIMIITQQYMNPFKYGEFIVVLALRVISMWYLRCPTTYRFDLIKFLRKGLSTNILKETEQNQYPLQRLSSVSNMNERLRIDARLASIATPPPPPSTPVNAHHFSFNFSDSNQSQSTTSQTTVTPSGEGLILDPNNIENSKIELVEACMDILSTLTFNTSSPLPMKKSIINKLIDHQKSMYWLVGHKIIQIATTGCSSRAVRNGLCQKCFYDCHLNEKEDGTSNSSSSSGSSTNVFGSKQVAFQSSIIKDIEQNNASKLRRRHQSEGVKKIQANKFETDSLVFLKRNPSTTSSDPDLKNRFCRCWCQAWAEITIRRATGNTRLIMRVENNLGDFPYWTYSKEEEDTLANIFAHSDPEINQALRLQKVSQTDDSQFDDVDEVKILKFSGDNKKSSRIVSRAASFGSKPSFISSSVTYDDQHDKKGKLEKDFSFDEDDIEATGTGSSSTSDNNGNSSSTPPYDESTKLSAATAAAIPIDTPTPSSGRNSATDSYRERSTTISVMSPAQKPLSSVSPGFLSARTPSTMSLGQQPSSGALSPQWVFLQLFYNSTFKELHETSPNDRPILLKKNDLLVSSISVFDLITPYETHKIGVLYIGPGQVKSKHEILANQVGSYRYAEFLKNLGQLVKLEDVDGKVCFLGGLSKDDGPYAISWGDHLVQAIFHVGTLMPNSSNDTNFISKMRHIGNDFVVIIYNNSGEEYSPTTIRGESQFMKAQICITPIEHCCNRVEVLAKNPDFNEFIGHTEAAIISDSALSVYVRQLALHSNLAAMVELQNQQLKTYNISNWITRLRHIKKIRTRFSDSTITNQSMNELAHSVRQSSFNNGISNVNNSQRFGQHNPLSTQSSRDESLSSGSGSAPQSASIIQDSINEQLIKLAFPDFIDYTEDLCSQNQSVFERNFPL